MRVPSAPFTACTYQSGVAGDILSGRCAGLLQGWARSGCLFATSILLSYLNYRGLTIVGRAAIGMTLFIVLTFLVLIGLSIPRLHPSNWLIVDWDAIEWRPFINVMFWCVPSRCLPSPLVCCPPVTSVCCTCVYGRPVSHAMLGGLAT